MDNTSVYRCRECGNRLEVRDVDDAPPLCCDVPMERDNDRPDVCEASVTAEHSRFSSTDEPCDDGRQGIR